MSEEEDERRALLRGAVLDSFDMARSISDDPWVHDSCQLGLQLWNAVFGLNLAYADMQRFAFLNGDLLRDMEQWHGIEGRFDPARVVAAFQKASSLLMEVSADNASESTLELAAQLRAWSVPEPALARPGERTPARSKIAEAQEAIHRYRQPGRDLLDRRRDFQDCVNAIYTAICVIESELISRSRSEGVDPVLKKHIRKIWPRPIGIEKTDPVMRWVLQARHVDNHQPADDPYLRITGTFIHGPLTLSSPPAVEIDTMGYIYNFSDEGSDRQLRYIVGRVPTLEDTLAWEAVDPPKSHRGGPLTYTGVDALLEVALQWVLDLYVASRLPLSAMGEWDSTWLKQGPSARGS